MIARSVSLVLIPKWATLAVVCLFGCHAEFAVKSMKLASLKFFVVVVSILAHHVLHIVGHAKFIRPGWYQPNVGIHTSSLHGGSLRFLNGP